MANSGDRLSGEHSKDALIQSIYKAVPVGIGLIVNRVFSEINDRFCEMLGYSRDELLGQSSRVIYESEEEFDRVGAIKYDLISRHGTGTVETRFVHKSGRILNIMLSSTPVDVNDLFLGVTFTALDITQQKRREDHLAHVNALLRSLRSIGDLISHLDDEKELLQSVAQILVECQGYAHVCIVGIDDQRELTHFATRTEGGRSSQSLMDGYISQLEQGIIPECMRRSFDCEGVMNRAYLDEACYLSSLTQACEKIGSLVCRIEHDGHLYGAIAVGGNFLELGDSQALDYFEEISNEIGLSIRNMRIKASKMREEARRRLFEKIVSTTNSLMSFIDRDGIYRSVNEEHTTRFGRAIDDIIGFPVSDLWSNTFFDQHVAPALKKTLKGQSQTLHEWYDFPLSGRRLLSCQFHPYRDEANKDVSGTIMVANDMTELEKARNHLADTTNRYLELINHMSAGVTVFKKIKNGSFLLVEANPAALRIINASHDSVMGEPIEKVFTGMGRSPLLDAMSQVERMGTPLSLVDVYYEFKETTFWADYFINRLASGELVVVFDDVSERKRFEKELIEERDKAKCASRAKDEFLMVMSHELRTPLNPIMGFAQLLYDMESDKQKRSFLKTILSSSKDMLNQIERILNFSRIQKGSVRLRKDRVRLGDLVDGLIQYTKNLEQGNVIRFHNGAERMISEIDMDTHIITDLEQLSVVLKGLLSNAFKFTHNGIITLVVGKLGSDQLYFEVEDTGVGIPEDKIANIFDPFLQADSSNTRAYEGMGLGLAVCKKIISLFKGSISCESTEGKGSKFKVILPLKVDQREQAFIPETHYEEMSVVKFAHRAKVIVAEDNRENQRLIRTYLERINAQVTCVLNGLELLEALEKDQYDIVLMDLSMPVMDGIEATVAIRGSEKAYRDIPIIAISAHISDSLSKECERAEISDFLAKPVGWVELKRCLKKWWP